MSRIFNLFLIAVAFLNSLQASFENIELNDDHSEQYKTPETIIRDLSELSGNPIYFNQYFRDALEGLEAHELQSLHISRQIFHNCLTNGSVSGRIYIQACREIESKVADDEVRPQEERTKKFYLHSTSQSINERVVLVPASLSGLPALQSIDLSNNTIYFIPTFLTQFSNLRYLDLSHNRIVSVPKSIAFLPKLTHLVLKDNFLVDLDDSLATLIHLEHLDLSCNAVINLPSTFGNMGGLKRLNLSRNCLIALPSSCERLKNLQVLDISSNKYNDFPTILLKIPSLKNLNIAHNIFTVLPSNLDQLSVLGVLTLSHNQMSQTNRFWIEQLQFNQKKKNIDVLRVNIVDPPLENKNY